MGLVKTLQLYNDVFYVFVAPDLQKKLSKWWFLSKVMIEILTKRTGEKYFFRHQNATIINTNRFFNFVAPGLKLPRYFLIALRLEFSIWVILLKCLISIDRRFCFNYKKKCPNSSITKVYIWYIYCKVIDKNLIFICFYIKDFFSRSIWVIPTKYIQSFSYSFITVIVHKSTFFIVHWKHH